MIISVLSNAESKGILKHKNMRIYLILFMFVITFYLGSRIGNAYTTHILNKTELVSI